MRIAYILESFPSSTEHFISSEILQLTQSGLEIEIFALRKDTTFETTDSEFANVKVHYLPSFVAVLSKLFRISFVALARIVGKVDHLNGWWRRAMTKYLHRLFKSRNITHIHAHFGFIATDIALFLAEVSGIPFSATLHAQDIYANDTHALEKKLRKATFVVTCTEFNKAYLLGKLGGEWRDRIHVVYHGVDLEKWSRVPQLDRPKSAYRVKLLTVARLVEKKGIVYLLEAIVILKDLGFSIECDVIGQGPLDKSLQSYSIRNGISELVRFRGYLSRDEIKQHLSDSDIFVLPCIIAKDGDRDGMPNVLMEAMAMEVPVISTNISAVPELLEHGINGIVLRQKDSTALAHAIIQLSTDTRLYQRIRNNSRQSLLRKFDSRTNCGRLDRIFKHSQFNA